MSTAEAVTVSVSAFAGVIATTTELVSEKLVSFASETRTLQVPKDACRTAAHRQKSCKSKSGARLERQRRLRPCEQISGTLALAGMHVKAVTFEGATEMGVMA